MCSPFCQHHAQPRSESPLVSLPRHTFGFVLNTFTSSAFPEPRTLNSASHPLPLPCIPLHYAPPSVLPALGGSGWQVSCSAVSAAPPFLLVGLSACPLCTHSATSQRALAFL